MAEAGDEPSVACTGDGHDKALAGHINGLYMAEKTYGRGPSETRGAVELATLEPVSWFKPIKITRARAAQCRRHGSRG